MVKKKDGYLIFIFIIFIISGFIFNHFYFKQSANIVEISLNNQIYQTVSLNTNQTINIDNLNTVIIKDGEVYIKEASCPDKLCMKQGKISKNGEQIICLPNQITVSISSNQNNDTDATVH